MQSNKRRQVCKDNSQPKLQFNQTKAFTTQPGGGLNSQEFQAKMQGYNFATPSVNAKSSATPFKSANRLNQLLKKSPFHIMPGQNKPSESSQIQSIGDLNFHRDISKPSSATTACTFAPNEKTYSVLPSAVPSQRKRREVKSDKKNSNQKQQLIGNKRQPQMKIDQMEFLTRLSSSSAKFVAKNIKLRDKKTGKEYDFPIFDEKNLEAFKNHTLVKDYDMSKLELEYDYDTDDEQMKHSAKMLLHELQQAIEFFIKDDPLKLVDNIVYL